MTGTTTETPVRQVPPREEKRLRRGFFWFFSIGAVAAYGPLTTLAQHYGLISRPLRLLVVVVVVLAMGWLLTWLTRRVGHSHATATRVAMVIVMMLLFGGRLGASVIGGGLTVLALGLLCAALLIRLQDNPLPGLLLACVAGGLWLASGLHIAQAISAVEAPTMSLNVGNQSTIVPDGRDVVVVFFDEFPDAATVASALGLDAMEHERALEALGFEVNASIPADFAFTEWAMPSFLMFGLPVQEGAQLSESTRRVLVRALGGQNPMVEAFRTAGYRITLVESGWATLGCGPPIDHCVPSPWYDEAVGAVLAPSLLDRPLGRWIGDPFTVGAERNIGWIQQSLAELTADDNLDFILIHMELPHRPLAFDSECRRREAADARDRTAHAMQVACAQQVMLDVASATDGTILLMLGDHGSDLDDVRLSPPDTWTSEFVRERLHTFAAVRGLDSCEEPAATSITNVGVRLMRCMGAEDVPYYDEPQFMYWVGEGLIDAGRFTPETTG